MTATSVRTLRPSRRAAEREEVEVIQVGQVPKRNITARLPGLPVGQ